MRLVTEDTVPRRLLARSLDPDDGYGFELTNTVLLEPGDHIDITDTWLVSKRADGSIRHRRGSWSTRCR